MALFFYVVGMEIKKELVSGELRDRRAVALPAMAALGGMIVPALIFVAFNAGGDGSRGWGIPMATDIAFALGVVALLGARVPGPVKVLLLTLAIVDDIGAIVVIAIFYSSGIDAVMLAVAVAIVAGVVVLHRLHVEYPPVLVAAGVALWLVVYESGVHATIAGVVMGLLTPAVAAQTELEADEVVDVLAGRPDLHAREVRATAALVKGSISACERTIDALHPWTSFVIVPLFALGNAGIELSGDAISSPSRVAFGVAVALVVGKFLGVVSFSWLAVRIGLGRLPTGARWSHMAGVGAVAGIGFTVSLFVTGLAFDDPGLQADAKIGILAASIVAATAGALVFSSIGAPRARPVHPDS
jgi:NhaA family Na+:H+ antiporter